MIRSTSITIDEAAQLAKCSYHTIHRAIKRGDLAAYKPGKTVLILESDLNAWFESKRIRAVKAGRPRREIRIRER
jgi:excisionase family DNA binding protein